MASVSKHPRSASYSISFRHGGKQFYKSLDTPDEAEALRLAAQIEQTLSDIRRGRLVVPQDADFWAFVRSDGRLAQEPTVEEHLTLTTLFEWYFEAHAGYKEENTRRTEQIHRDHILRLMPGDKPLPTFSAEDAQRFVNARAAERYRGKLVTATTIKKELDTLRMVWNKAVLFGRVATRPSFAAVRFPKRREKLPFQTWAEIERTVSRDGLTGDRAKEQWDSLFLDVQQIGELLEFVRNAPRKSAIIYPVIVFAAHTGARKSEIIRSRIEDLKFDDREIVLRERKREQGRITFRRVPMSDLLATALMDYLRTAHPGGGMTVCHQSDVPVEANSLYETWDWFFKGTKWSVLRGYHVLRHSFASNLARAGTDQRVIDELMGHTTEAMRKRYRHLFPEQRHDAVRKLFP